MHDGVLIFVNEVKNRFPNKFTGVRVLELGSLDINGSVRTFFDFCEYVGVDWRKGPSVDIVNFAHELDYPNETFDTVISTEMFEHDKFAELSFINGLRMLKKGGLFVFTCANPNRLPHLIEAGVSGYYRGLSKFHVIAWLLEYRDFSELYLQETDVDLRGWIVK